MSFWHAYGGFVPEDGPDLQGAWMQAIVGPTDSPDPPGVTWNLATAYGPNRADGFPELPYLATWDHEPTDVERHAMEPGAMGPHLILLELASLDGTEPWDWDNGSGDWKGGGRMPEEEWWQPPPDSDPVVHEEAPVWLLVAVYGLIAGVFVLVVVAAIVQIG